VAQCSCAKTGDLVPVAPAPPLKLGAAHVERGGDEDAHASAHDLVERDKQQLVSPATSGSTRIVSSPSRSA
jgi:hypothetical protein